MKPLTLMGIVRIALGIAGLVFGGITYTETADLGAIDVSFSEKETLAIHPAIGAVVLAGGLFLTVAGVRRA